MKTQLLVSVVGLLTFWPAATYPQVTARQGEAPPSEIVRFASPMILDLPLPNVLPLEPGTQLQLPKVGKYICDENVQLLNLTIAKRYTGPRKARALELLITGAVLVSDSYDRRVDIALRLKSGDAVLGSQILRNLSAEEERSSPFRILIPVPEGALVSAFGQGPAPSLELILTVRDNS